MTLLSAFEFNSTAVLLAFVAVAAAYFRIAHGSVRAAARRSQRAWSVARKGSYNQLDDYALQLAFQPLHGWLEPTLIRLALADANPAIMLDRLRWTKNAVRLDAATGRFIPLSRFFNYVTYNFLSWCVIIVAVFFLLLMLVAAEYELAQGNVRGVVAALVMFGAMVFMLSGLGAVFMAAHLLIQRPPSSLPLALAPPLASRSAQEPVIAAENNDGKASSPGASNRGSRGRKAPSLSAVKVEPPRE